MTRKCLTAYGVLLFVGTVAWSQDRPLAPTQSTRPYLPSHSAEIAPTCPIPDGTPIIPVTDGKGTTVFLSIVKTPPTVPFGPFGGFPGTLAARDTGPQQALIAELLQLSRQLYQMGQHQAAQMVAERACRLDPVNPFAVHAIAMARLVSCREQSRAADAGAQDAECRVSCERNFDVGTAKTAGSCCELRSSNSVAASDCAKAVPVAVAPLGCDVGFFTLRLGSRLGQDVIVTPPVATDRPAAPWPVRVIGGVPAARVAVAPSARNPARETVRFQCDGRIRLMTPFLEASADRLSSSGTPERVILEGNVCVTYHRGDRPVKITGQRVVINLRDGSYEFNTTDATRPAGADVIRQIFVNGLTPAGSIGTDIGCPIRMPKPASSAPDLPRD